MVYGASNQDVREFTKTLVAAIHTPATFIMKEIAEVHHLEKEKKSCFTVENERLETNPEGLVHDDFPLVDG